MSPYCIKYIWGPGGPNYPGENRRIHFSNEKSARDFARCDGLFLYETGGNPMASAFGLSRQNIYGRKMIYAQGVVVSQNIGYEATHPAEHFYYIEVDLSKRIHPTQGIPLKRIKEILGLKERSTIQRRGGLFWLTEEQFHLLSKELDKCLNNA